MKDTSYHVLLNQRVCVLRPSFGVHVVSARRRLLWKVEKIGEEVLSAPGSLRSVAIKRCNFIGEAVAAGGLSEL